MKTFAIDLESYFSRDHSAEVFGAINYLAHPASDVYLLSVAGSDGFRWSGRPEDFNWALLQDARVIAHNASFDCAIFQVRGLPTPKAINCTAHLAGYLGSPQALPQAAKRLLGVEVSKEPRAKMKGRRWAEVPESEKAELLAYNARDAELCLGLWERHSSSWPLLEQELSAMTVKMCHRGVAINKGALESSISLAQEIREEALKKIPWANETPLSLPKARAQCQKVGIPAPESFAEKSESCAIWEAQYGEPHGFVRGLRDFRKANILLRKLEAMKRRIMPDGRMNFDLRYAGTHTLRWAGMGGLNVQNFAREPWKGIYLRELLIPAPGKKFIICDLSAIEPRVLAWIAGDETLLSAMRHGHGVYEAQALVWGLWSGEKGTLKTANPGLYNYIKSLSLGCGYGMGWVKFRSICAQRGIVFSPAEARERIAQYRAHNPKVIRLWRRLDHELSLQRAKGIAKLRLPSGRTLLYPELTNEKGGLWATFQTAEGFRKTKIWGGFVTENAVSAVARDIFAEGLLRLEAAGICIVMHSHDEVVVEVNEKKVFPEEITHLMTITPDWACGLPLAAEAKETWAYAK